MRIEVKGRNLQVTDELRECVAAALREGGQAGLASWPCSRSSSREERNPANPEGHVAEATLHLKGVTLRATSSSRDIKHSINLIADELARQVKRHRDKRRRRREQRAAAQSPPPRAGGRPGAPGTLPAV